MATRRAQGRTGLDVSRHIRAALAALPGGVDAALDRVAIAMTADIQRSFKPGTGREYRRGSVTHRASAPGQPPAVDTGRLRASITWRRGGTHKTNWRDVGTNVLYAVELEKGTSKTAPRPFMLPAAERLRTYGPAVVAEQVEQAQRRAVT